MNICDFQGCAHKNNYIIRFTIVGLFISKTEVVFSSFKNEKGSHITGNHIQFRDIKNMTSSFQSK